MSVALIDQATFDEIFLQARLKVNRANRHINEAHHWFSTYAQSDFYRIIDDTDPETGHQRIGLAAEPIPADLILAIGDAFHCLSASLDYVMSGLMRAKTGNSSRISFPTDESRKALRKSFMAPGNDACGKPKKAPANRRIVKAFPALALQLLTVIKPYKGEELCPLGNPQGRQHRQAQSHHPEPYSLQVGEGFAD